MRFARKSYITWFSKLSFRVYFRKLFRIPSGTQCFHIHQLVKTKKPVAKRALTLELHFFANVASGYLPVSFRILPGTNSNLFRRGWVEPFQASLLRTITENSTKPSGFTSGNPSGTFRIPSGMQCFAHCRKPSGFPSGNPSGIFRKPSGMQRFQHALRFYPKSQEQIISQH